MARVRPDDMVTVLYTSGTTGNPKGVRITHRNVLYEAARSTRAGSCTGPPPGQAPGHLPRPGPGRPREWTSATGEVTATLKLRRRVIHARYASVIDELYTPERA